MKKKKFEINVTKLDIARGKRYMCHTCPIARALRRAFRLFLKHPLRPHSVSASAALDSELGLRGGQFVFSLPKIACDFIENFDRRNGVTPFRFYLHVPASLLKLKA